MPIKYDELMALKNVGQKYAWTDREIMLYAYGIGMGADPMDPKELPFVNEGYFTPRDLKVVPTYASVAAWTLSTGTSSKHPAAAALKRAYICQAAYGAYCGCFSNSVKR